MFYTLNRVKNITKYAYESILENVLLKQKKLCIGHFFKDGNISSRGPEPHISLTNISIIPQ